MKGDTLSALLLKIKQTVKREYINKDNPDTEFVGGLLAKMTDVEEYIDKYYADKKREAAEMIKLKNLPQ